VSVAPDRSPDVEHFELLDAPSALLASDPTPMPYAAPMEDAWLPDAARIRAEAAQVVGSGGGDAKVPAHAGSLDRSQSVRGGL
jgi:hypothetical protein